MTLNIGVQFEYHNSRPRRSRMKNQEHQQPFFNLSHPLTRATFLVAMPGLHR